MSKSALRRSSQSRPLLGNSEDLIQSPCSRHRIFIRVSARLQATAAPEAPAPMIRTSTISSVERAASGLASAVMSFFRGVNVAPHSRPAAHRLQQGPIALFQLAALRIGRPRLDTEGAHHAIVAVITLQ